MACEHCRDSEWHLASCLIDEDGIEQHLDLKQRCTCSELPNVPNVYLVRYNHPKREMRYGEGDRAYDGIGDSPEMAQEDALRAARQELICKLAWVDRQLLKYLGKRIAADVAGAAKTKDA